MVVVAKMRSEYVAEYDEYAEQEAAFNHFLSAFPCLAIPFSDEVSRHAIIKLIGLSDLILDPQQNVLQTYAECIHKYGVAAFPFTQNHLLDLDRKDKELKMRLDPIYKVTGYRAFPRYHVYDPEDPLVNKPPPLEELLCCKPDTILERFGEKVTVSELSKKRCVLLYLCYNGEFMYSLDRICNKYGNKYEIVFISAPINSEELSHSKAIQLVLSEENISSSSSWWQLTTLADEDMRRLFRIGRVTSNLSDVLITWADGGTNGELNAIPLIRRFGYDIYPCTRKQLLDERLTWLRSLTLESFLGQNARLCSSVNLKNRDILLYFNLWDHLGVEELDELREYYALFKKDNPAAEMIFVPMDAKPLDDARRVPCPRLSHPPEPSHPTVVKLFKIRILDSSCVVALGADKQIKKVFYVDSLSDKRVRVSLFEDTLLEDVRRNVFERLVY